MTGTYIDPFIMTEAEILEIYKIAREHIRRGKTQMSYNGEGTEAGSQFTAKPDDIMRECTWALKSKNPQRYGFIVTDCKVFFC